MAVLSASIDETDSSLVDRFIQRAELQFVADDSSKVVYRQFGGDRQPYFVVINGVADSPGRKQWEILYLRSGYGSAPLTAELRAVIDGVKAPVAPLPVVIAPTISTQPRSRIAQVGTSVEFSVNASGSDPLASWSAMWPAL